MLLPVEPDARVPDWILDRTPTEVKAAYAAAVRKREQGQVTLQGRRGPRLHMCTRPRLCHFQETRAGAGDNRGAERKPCIVVC